MNQEQDGFEALKQQLAVDPSPAFAVQVRAAVAAERSAGTNWRRTLVWATAAAATAIVWIANMERPPFAPAETQVGAKMDRPVFRPAGETDTPAETRAATAKERPALRPAEERVARTQRPVFRPAERPTASAAEILVDPADAEAVSRLMAYVTTSPALTLPADSTGGSPALEVIELAPMPPIEVSPIVVALLYEEPQSAQGERQ